MVLGDGLSNRILGHTVLLLRVLKVVIHYRRDVNVVPVFSVAVSRDVFQLNFALGGIGGPFCST